MDLLGSFVIAFSMYSRIPMPLVEWSEKRMKYAMCFFPAVGVAVALVLWAAVWVCTRLEFQWLGKLLPPAIPVLVTGGIHMDGFLDTVDALSSHQSREKKLEILKDPHTGAFAIIGACVYFMMWTGFWGEISPRLLPAFGGVFVVERALSGLSVVTFPMAKKTGLAASFSGQAHKKAVASVMILYLAAAFSYFAVTAGITTALSVAAVSGLVFFYYKGMAKKEFGGITGDLAGFFLQICELALTALFAVASVFSLP